MSEGDWQGKRCRDCDFYGAVKHRDANGNEGYRGDYLCDLWKTHLSPNSGACINFLEDWNA